MSDMEIKSIYKTCYLKVLDSALKIKLSDPLLYPTALHMTEELRDWVLTVTDVDSLPEPPKP